MQNKNTKISVIIGVLNMHQYIERTLISVINQQYPNLELIVMDGGSTDGTLDIIKKYESHITYWQSQPDKGHPDACNKAIEYATGELIGFLNADDFYEADILQKTSDCYQQHPTADVISCGTRVIERDKHGNDRVLWDFFAADKLHITLRNMLFEFTAFNGKFFKKDIFTRFGKFDATDSEGRTNRSNDREFLLRLAFAKINSHVIPEPLYVYLSHQGASSFSKKNLERIHKEHLLLAEKLLAIPTLSSTEKNLIKKWWARESVYLFLTTLRQCEFKKSLGVVMNGLAKTHWRWGKELIRYTGKKLFCSFL